MSDEHDDERPDAADDALLVTLGAAFGPDPLPDGLIDRAEGLLAWADVDDELALLLEEQAEPAGVRGSSTAGLLRFAVPDGSTEIELEDTPAGWVVRVHDEDPTGEVAVDVLRPNGERQVAERDLSGAVVLPPGTSGVLRVRVSTVRGVVTSEWFLLEGGQR